MTKSKVLSLTWGMIVILNLMGAGAWAGIVCRDEGWRDRNTDTPTALPPDKGGSGQILKCYLDTADMWTKKGPKYGNFKIFFNRCGSSCTDEQIMDYDGEYAAHFLECAYDLYLQREMAPSSLLFNDPLKSKWMDVTNKSTSDKHIPVWISKNSGGGGASRDPHLEFPAHGRIHDPITTNAIHEFGHLVVNGYSSYLGGGYVPLVKEGIPTFFEYVLRDDVRYPESDETDEQCGGERFIDLSNDSLRAKDYCDATPFWHFISSFTLRDDPEYYENITPACRIYLEGLEVPPKKNKMRRIPGRDVIRAVLEGLSKCYPEARQTPVCTNNNGYAAYCSNKSTYSNSIFKNSNGCQPDGDLFPTNSEEQQAERLHAIGELMMPLTMDILDGVFWSRNFAGGQNPRFHDGIRNVMYRQYLERNFVQPDAPNKSIYRKSSESDFFIKSFGVHYHPVDISTGARTVTLIKRGDLPKWAYGAFYKGPCVAGTCITAVDGWDSQGYRNVSAWKNRSSDTLVIPSHPNFTKAVVIVTGFEGTYDLDAGYSQSGGHYDLDINP
jgi:hypothetical protein